MKYRTINQAEHLKNVGTVTINGHELQLCDHLERVDGKYCVSALYQNNNDTQFFSEQGTQTKTLPHDVKIAYISKDMLERAIPKYNDDNMTSDLIDRLLGAMQKMNTIKAAA